MRNVRLGLIGIAAAALAVLSGQDAPPAAPAAEARPKSFVRMDLLTRPPREMMPPRRGIFAPSAVDEDSGAAADDAGSPAIPVAGRRAIGGVAVEGGEPVAESAAFASLSLRYIGFVKSPRAVVGLVLVHGQAMAVMTGDTVADFYRVGAVGPREIEVLSADGSKMTFPLEGEEE
ncbi:MAG: hypothetical protein JW742_01620 [Candidatus Aminicenantes bacterium]|nr:hypothetical protein [Candidatus Aminicenantes bacterium]